MQGSKIVKCQNCKASFTIDASDFEFYAKIKVPAPTFCHGCKMARRMIWRNERSLHRRKCDAPGHNEEIVSMYSSDKQFKIYDQKNWWSDNWSPMDYGRDYDWTKPFFEQFKELILDVPRVALKNKNAINSEYCNITMDNKDCYLVFGGDYNENVNYSTFSFYCKDSMDLYWSSKNELSYENIDCRDSYKLFFSQYSDNCVESMFLYNCKNLDNCLGCINLKNKKYHIFHKPYSKEEYFKELEKLQINTYKGIEIFKKKFYEFKLKFPNKFIRETNSYNVSGNNIHNSRNCIRCFDVWDGVEDCKDVFMALDKVKDGRDIDHYGFGSELCYDSTSMVTINAGLFTTVAWNGYNIQYSDDCQDCNNIFGCSNLRNKQYCILNKQYTKEQYEELIPKIIQHMNDQPYISKIPNNKPQITNKSQNLNSKTQTREILYRYGEFFPPELSPFAYNETVAQEYFPLTKEQAIEKGYKWKEPETRNYKITIKFSELPDHIKDVPDSIVNEIIGCEHEGKCNEQCTTAFKIIPKELEFYKKHNIPLPRLCPNCRHYQRIKQRNPLKLWHRKCQCNGTHSDNEVYKNTINHQHHDTNHCPNEFETTYAPERKEIVYCEKCYQNEVV